MSHNQPDQFGQPSQPSQLDRILLEQDLLLPSSGFAASVMDSIQQQSPTPAPIPFPWKLALPGFAALLAGVIVICKLAIMTIRSMSQTYVTSFATDSASNTAWLWPHLNSSSALDVLLRNAAAPILLTLAASWLCVLLCRRFAGEVSR